MTRMEYSQVERLAEAVAEAADELTTGGRPLADDRVSAAALGNTDSANDCLTALRRAQSTARTATRRLVTVLDDDADRLRQAVVAFQQTDHETADQMFAASRDGINVYSAHVHSDGSNDDDFVRADQIDRLRESVDGPAVIGADLNAELDDGNMSADAVARFGDDGFDVNAGEVGGTSSTGRSIDYVMPSSGVSASNATEVDGATSDHNGQRVDVTIPRW
jgi:hypothetical protein